MDLDKARLKCECGGSMRKIVTPLRGFSVRGWKCSKCSEELIHPLDLDRVMRILEAKKRKELQVKVRVIGDSQVVTIPKIIRDIRGIEKGETLEWGIEHNTLVLKEEIKK